MYFTSASEKRNFSRRARSQRRQTDGHPAGSTDRSVTLWETQQGAAGCRRGVGRPAEGDASSVWRSQRVRYVRHARPRPLICIGPPPHLHRTAPRAGVAPRSADVGAVRTDVRRSQSRARTRVRAGPPAPST